MTEEEVKIITEEILLALNFMHSKMIVHRDLKPQNILLEDPDTLEVKLTDFGFATVYDDETKLKTKLGSPYYMAPEILKR